MFKTLYNDTTGDAIEEQVLAQANKAIQHLFPSKGASRKAELEDWLIAQSSLTCSTSCGLATSSRTTTLAAGAKHVQSHTRSKSNAAECHYSGC